MALPFVKKKCAKYDIFIRGKIKYNKLWFYISFEFHG